ncbi:CPBP family intramembrane glutamic endopeptidase [Phenylobacterium sp.]|uniref:CPBP family intramembrane glutamic endopeptidase n=1 Tax=Phenylobacterium sp. TaxID=1871053 RepID=UPI00271C568C|nr:CPBP family intramembrane glutamic endopeptidase [Phenylobacterium sp.]MDO8380533.1 CPBP family intramembrane metalloprotease [Phenylobacterium sp.]
MSRRKLAAYVALIYLLSWGVQLGAIATVGDLESPDAAPWLLATMFVPALVTLAFVRLDQSARKAFAWKPSWRMAPLMLVAVLVPTLIAFGVVAAVEAAAWGRSRWFDFGQTGVTISGGPWLLGKGAQAWPLFLANVAATGAAFAVMNGLVAMGEEAGWRGLLQGQLIARLGTVRGIALLGLIWSFWHLPSLLAGYNFPQHPVLGALVIFPIELVAVSFFLGWLTLKSGSFWAAAVAHGAGNSIEEGVVSNLHLTVSQLHEDLLRMGFTVLVGLVFWALVRRRATP